MRLFCVSFLIFALYQIIPSQAVSRRQTTTSSAAPSITSNVPSESEDTVSVPTIGPPPLPTEHPPFIVTSSLPTTPPPSIGTPSAATEPPSTPVTFSLPTTLPPTITTPSPPPTTSSAQHISNVANEFYIGFMDNYVKPAFQDIDTLIINRSIIFMTTSDPSGAIVMVESEQGTSMDNLTPRLSGVRSLDHYKVRSGTDRNKGIKIKAEQSKQISVVGINEELHSIDGFTALPCSYLPSVTSYEYYAVSVPPSTVSLTSAKSAFLIVACSNHTTVSVTPSQDIMHPVLPNLSVRAGTTFTVELQERQTLYVQDYDDLTGSKVTSQKPISFFSGHECGNVPANVAECDHLVEQIPPTATWGTQFILAPTAHREADDIIKVISSEDNTTGFITCKNTDNEVEIFNSTIERAGTFTTQTLSHNTYCFVEADKPILMVQFTAGGGADGADSADPFMVIIPAVSQYLDVTTFSTITSRSFDFNNFINIFVPAGPNVFNPSSIVIDEGAILEVERWISIPCPKRSDYTCAYAAQAHIDQGVHTIWNRDGGPVGITVYGLDYLETYAYVAGLKLTVPGFDGALTTTSHFVLPGTSICMPCESSEYDGISHPPVWTKDGTVITASLRVYVNTNRSLCITTSEPRDSGTYVCHLSGFTFESTLTVTGGIIVEPPTCGTNETGAVTGAVIGIGQETAYLDSDTEFFEICCRVLAPPGYTVSWFRDDSLITPRHSGYELGDDSLRYVGILSHGCVKYTCRVNYQTATFEEKTQICIGDIAPPTHVNITGELNVLENTTVSYQCSADGFPAPTRLWTAFRDSNTLLPSNASDNGNGNLTVRVTELDASLKYCCDVTNQHGNILSECIMINVLIAPKIIKGPSKPIVNVYVPYGVSLPLKEEQNATILIGNNVMIPVSYNLIIKCGLSRGNPEPTYIWYKGTSILQGSQYTVQDDGTLVIDRVTSGRDDGVYTCVADSPNVGQDVANSTVIVTVPPKINSSSLVTNPGNCLDLTKEPLGNNNIVPVGVDVCVWAGVSEGRITLSCNIVEGTPAPSVQWLKDGYRIAKASDTLELRLSYDAYGSTKEQIEGNYTCLAYNIAGSTTMETHLTLFGDIPIGPAHTDFVKRQKHVYHLLHQTISEHFPKVKDGSSQHLMFFTSGKILTYEDFDPGYLYDESEESVLPQTMENMFDLVDVVPNGGSIVFNPDKAQKLEETYTQLVEMLHVAPSYLAPEEQSSLRLFLQDFIQDPATGDTLPRLSLYLRYKDIYYTTKMEVDNLIDSQRHGMLGWEFTQWYERNIHRLQMKINDAYMQWEMYANKAEVEDKLNILNLEDHSQDINDARALLLANQRMSRFKDEKDYYLVKLYPDTWYKDLRNRVQESIEQMQFKLSQIKTEIEILEITSRYLDKESREREALNELFPSLDPVFQLYCDLDTATYRLEEIVKESEDMRYECLVSGNPADCHLYWGLREHIRDQVLGNYTEFYWYVHTVQAALNHREYSIPVIGSTISKLQVQINHIQSAIDIALSDLSQRSTIESNSKDENVFTDFMYNPTTTTLYDHDFDLPSSLIGRLLWYINPESTTLLPKELIQEYNLTINHLNTAFTNVSAKLSSVNIHRRWFKAGLFGNKHLKLAVPDILVSPGEIQPPEHFRDILKNNSYDLPLYPTSLLLATDIQLTVDIPYVYHTLPTLIKLSYDPHVTGGFGPFSFGPLYKANAGQMKFRVSINDNKISITLPGTQLIGYVSDVVPQHPREIISREPRLGRSTHFIKDPHNLQSTDSEFDHWLFSKNKKELKLQDSLLNKDSNSHANEESAPTKPSSSPNRGNVDDTRENLSILITPTVPLNSMHTTTILNYYNSTL